MFQISREVGSRFEEVHSWKARAVVALSSFTRNRQQRSRRHTGIFYTSLLSCVRNSFAAYTQLLQFDPIDTSPWFDNDSMSSRLQTLDVDSALIMFGNPAARPQWPRLNVFKELTLSSSGQWRHSLSRSVSISKLDVLSQRLCNNCITQTTSAAALRVPGRGIHACPA